MCKRQHAAKSHFQHFPSTQPMSQVCAGEHSWDILSRPAVPRKQCNPLSARGFMNNYWNASPVHYCAEHALIFLTITFLHSSITIYHPCHALMEFPRDNDNPNTHRSSSWWACIPNNLRLTPARDASYRRLSLLKRSEMSTVKCREHRGCSVTCEFQINNTDTAFLHINVLSCPWLSVPTERIYTESYFDLQVSCNCALRLAFALSQTANVGIPLRTTQGTMHIIYFPHGGWEGRPRRSCTRKRGPPLPGIYHLLAVAQGLLLFFGDIAAPKLPIHVSLSYPNKVRG